MQKVTPAFLRTILGAHRVARKVEFSNDGITWRPLRLVSGSVDASRTSQIRYGCNITVDANTPVDLENINPFATRLRIFRGVHISRGWPQYARLGIHQVQTVAEDLAGNITISGQGYEKIGQDARFLTPRTIGGDNGDTARGVLEDLVREFHPGAGFDWRVDGNILIPTIHQDTDRWAVIDGGANDPSIAKALGAECYFDATGTFVIAPTPTLKDNPIWTIPQGEAMINPNTEISRDGVYNVVVAMGSSTDSSRPPVGPGIAWDNDPSSPTYAGPDPVNRPELAGPFGVVPRFYTSPLLLTVDSCTGAAQSILADALGLHKTVSFDVVANPALEPGDVVRADVKKGYFESHIIDSISWDLMSPAMTCQTRATTTRLLGLGGVEVTGETGDISIDAELTSA